MAKLLGFICAEKFFRFLMNKLLDIGRYFMIILGFFYDKTALKVKRLPMISAKLKVYLEKFFTMKRTLLLFILTIILVFNTHKLTAQGLMYEVPLIEQVQRSTQVIEGKVISKESFWNTNEGNIFTVNTVEVYKVFKGAPNDVIEIITPGGTVGLAAEIVTPSLNLSEGQTGVFILEDTAINLARPESSLRSYVPYSSSQGFYAYNLMDNNAANGFKVKNGITQTLYSELIELTNQDYISVRPFDVDALVQQYNSNASSQPIVSITPLVTTAGTQSTITITGFAFGATQGSVEFANADSGGANFISALSSQIVSWSDTEVVVEVPSRAGTGRVRVVSAAGPISTSTQDITVNYAELNVVTGGFAYPTQHIDENGNGGATWRMQIDFDSNASAKASFLRAFDTWVCETGINWENGAITFTDNATLDGINIVRFDNGSELPPGVLGRNTSYWSGCNQGGQISWFVNELDIVFNDTTNWQFGPAPAGGSQIDFESVAVHELGHGHQLGHVIDNNKIMHFAIGPGTTSRTLSQDDIDAGNDVQQRSVNNPVCGESPMTNSACSLSVGDFVLNDKISIYPIPAKNNIFIESAADVQLSNVELIDVQGRFVTAVNLSGNSSLYSIDLNNLDSGIYFLKISTKDNKELIKKIVLE
jgi:hypothetical protein